MSSGIQKNSIALSIRLCLTDPYAFARSNQITCSSGIFSVFAVFIRSHSIAVCSIQPGKPGTPAFCIDVLTNPFFSKKFVILLAMTPKKILPSTLSRDIGRNWSISFESFSFGMWIPFANPQFSAMNPFSCAFFKSFQRSANTLGHLL